MGTGNIISSDGCTKAAPSGCRAARRRKQWLVAGLCLSAVLSSPLAAQQATEPSLRDLIPDSAVEDPEGWAQQTATEGVPADAGPDLEANSPLAEMPLVDIPWPDEDPLPPILPLQPETADDFAEIEDLQEPVPVLAGDVQRLSSELTLAFPDDGTLFPERDNFVERFKSLSTVEQLDAEGNVGRLAAQAAEDEELLQRLLRIYGYYDADVIRSVAGAEDAPTGDGDNASTVVPSVRFDILPGQQFRFGAIDLGRLSEAVADYPVLRETFGIDPGDPLLADRIVEGRYALDEKLGETGYAFAAISEPDLLVDHARRQGDLTLPVTPGGKYIFGTVTSNMPDFLSAEHLADIARFDQGDLYQRSLELDLRQAILATGLVASAQVRTVEVIAPSDGAPGTVDLAVDMTAARLRTLAGSIGFGTGEGFKLQGSWEHRNLFPPEGALRVRGIAGTREQLAGVTFTKNNFGGRDRILTLDAFVSTIDYQLYDARTASLVGRFERVSNLLFQKPFTYGVGFELVATQESERKRNLDVIGPRQTFFIAALPAQIQVDSSDSLLDPTRGFRAGISVSPEISRLNSVNSTYGKVQFDLSAYRPVTEKVVLAARARVGTIVGAPITAIAPSRRFYAGGGGSVRGYSYKAIGERDALGEPNGGRSLLELSAEARIRTGLMDGAVSVVPFVDAGLVNEDTLPDFSDIRLGAGVGVRYHTSFGPLRLDLGIPLNPQPGDAKFGVYVALGQAF
jgi:translocation and assembly module TamA